MLFEFSYITTKYDGGFQIVNELGFISKLSKSEKHKEFQIPSGIDIGKNEELYSIYFVKGKDNYFLFINYNYSTDISSINRSNYYGKHIIIKINDYIPNIYELSKVFFGYIRDESLSIDDLKKNIYFKDNFPIKSPDLSDKKPFILIENEIYEAITFATTFNHYFGKLKIPKKAYFTFNKILYDRINSVQYTKFLWTEYKKNNRNKDGETLSENYMEQLQNNIKQLKKAIKENKKIVGKLEEEKILLKKEISKSKLDIENLEKEILPLNKRKENLNKEIVELKRKQSIHKKKLNLFKLLVKHKVHLFYIIIIIALCLIIIKIN